MAKKMGRPRLPGSECLGEFLIIRVRPGEKRATIQAARKAGQPHTVWMRQVLLRAARRAARSAGA